MRTRSALVSSLPALVMMLAASLVLAQDEDLGFTDIEKARETTAGPLGSQGTRGPAGVRGTAAMNEVRTPGNSGIEFGMTDRRAQLFSRLPGGLVLIVSQSKATFMARGTLPATITANVQADARADISGRLRINSKEVVDGLLDQLEGLPPAPGGLPGVPEGWTPPSDSSGIPDITVEQPFSGHSEGHFNADGTIDNIGFEAGIGKETRGVLVAVPVTGKLHFFAGMRQVKEYVVVAVQGFDYQYSYNGSASGVVSALGTGLSASESRSISGGGSGHVETPGLRRRFGWEYNVAAVGVGYRSPNGGFHLLADLEWSGNTPDLEGYIDVGPLRKLKMPGPVRDVDVGGDFRAGGFSTGANVKLFTFAGYAAGGQVDMFMNQKFSSVDLGLSYRGKARGLMADQSAALSVAFKPTDNTRLTLIGGVRLLSSYSPGVSESYRFQDERTTSGNFSDGGHNYEYAGNYFGQVSGNARADLDVEEGFQHRMFYSPGLKLDLLDSGVSLQGGPILDDQGEMVGGQGGVSIVKDRMEFGATVHSTDGYGSGGALTLGVVF